MHKSQDYATADKYAGRPVIYCDGCSRRGVCGIGVLSEQLGIDVSQRLLALGTNNVAECEAVLHALKIAKEMGVRGAVIYSDSRLVVNWIRGRYRVKSETGQKYVPVLKALVAEVEAIVRWIPGKTNPADKPSRIAVYGEEFFLTDAEIEVVKSVMAALPDDERDISGS